jgi:hypothetical protein
MGLRLGDAGQQKGEGKQKVMHETSLGDERMSGVRVVIVTL